jgi:hypothetical protein
MSFRFYRCYRVSPGLHVNFSKSGLSLTMGSGRTHVTFGPRGLSSSIRIGGGLSWRGTGGHHQPAGDAYATPPASTRLGILLAVLFVVGLLVGTLLISSTTLAG